MNPSRVFILRPVATTLLMAALLVVGRAVVFRTRLYRPMLLNIGLSIAPVLVLGVGCERGCPADELIALVRGTLAAHGLGEALFEEVGRQLDARGLIIRRGTLIDATLLQASVKPPWDCLTLLPDYGPAGKVPTDLEGCDDEAEEEAVFAGI